MALEEKLKEKLKKSRYKEDIRYFLRHRHKGKNLLSKVLDLEDMYASSPIVLKSIFEVIASSTPEMTIQDRVPTTKEIYEFIEIYHSGAGHAISKILKPEVLDIVAPEINACFVETKDKTEDLIKSYSTNAFLNVTEKYNDILPVVAKAIKTLSQICYDADFLTHALIITSLESKYVSEILEKFFPTYNDYFKYENRKIVYEVAFKIFRLESVIKKLENSQYDKSQFAYFISNFIDENEGNRKKDECTIDILEKGRCKDLGEIDECAEVNAKVSEDFLILKKLGRGLYKNVYLAQRKDDKRLLAFKFYDVEDERGYEILNAMQKTLEELMISDMSVWIFDYNKPPALSGTDKWKDNESGYFLVEIPFEKNLEDLLNEKGGELQMSDVYWIVKEIVEGISKLHSQYKRTHGDIKPANIGYGILDYENEEIVSRPGILITDIGDSTIIEKSNEICDGKMYFGSIDTRAPELFSSENADSRSDVYSLGATIYWLFAGEFPFSSGKKSDLTPEKRKEYDEEVKSKAKNPSNYAQLDKKIDEVFNNLNLPSLGWVVKECLKYSPAERPKSASVIKGMLAAMEKTLSDEEEYILFDNLGVLDKKLRENLT